MLTLGAMGEVGAVEVDVSAGFESPPPQAMADRTRQKRNVRRVDWLSKSVHRRKSCASRQVDLDPGKVERRVKCLHVAYSMGCDIEARSRHRHVGKTSAGHGEST